MFLDLKSGDRGQAGPYEMASGLWPRFSHYEVRDQGERRFICPVAGSQVALYDPWQEHNGNLWADAAAGQGREGRQAGQPYLTLLGLWHNLAIDPRNSYGAPQLFEAELNRLGPEQHTTVCRWCAGLGLLGTMFHQVRMFRLPYIDRQPAGNIYKSITFYKDQGGWRLNDAQLPARPGQTQKELMASIEVWERGRVELETYDSSSLFMNPWDTRDWPDPSWLAANFFPFSDSLADCLRAEPWQRVWQSYCEPLSSFLYHAALVAGGILSLAEPDNDGRHAVAVRHLQRLVGQTQLSYDHRGGRIRPILRTPSLLSAFSLMALEEYAAGYRLRRCANDRCGQWFRARRKNARFCCLTCNNAHQQRRSRSRQKKQTVADTLRRCHECGASLAGKRPQAKFCSTTCGNTFRKRRQRAQAAASRLR